MPGLKQSPVTVTTKIQTSVASLLLLVIAVAAGTAFLGAGLGYAAFSLGKKIFRQPAAISSTVVFTRGDVNDDGKIDIADAIVISDFLFNKKAINCWDAADANDDGRNDIADMVYILNYLYQNGPRPPEPFQSCGLDPTPDQITCGKFNNCRQVAIGSLTITKAPTSPQASLLPSNTPGLTAGVFRINAKDEEILINSLYLSADSVQRPSLSAPDSALDQIEKISLYDGANLLAQTFPTTTESSGSHTVFLDLSKNPLKITPNTVKDITIKVDTAKVGKTERGSAGQGFILSINAPTDIRAVGVTSGNKITNINLTGATFPEMIVYKSVPTITTNDQMGAEGVASGAGRLTGNMSLANLYKFKVYADQKGDIGIYQVAFLVSLTSTEISKIYLYDGIEFVASTSIGKILSDGPTKELIYTLNPEKPKSKNYTVTANQNITFTVKADIICGQGCLGPAGSGSVAIQLLGDSAFPDQYPASALNLSSDLYHNSLIWTDYSASGNLGSDDINVLSNKQWTNGYRVASALGKLSPTSTAVTISK